jgi:transcriptional regulator with XRE-family HTH domain
MRKLPVKTFGQRLHCLRTAEGKSLREMAADINSDASHIARVEKGRGNLNLECMAALNTVYGADLNWLILGIGEMHLN